MKYWETLSNLHHQKWNPDENPEDTFRYIEINSVSRETGEASFSKLPNKEGSESRPIDS